VPGGQSIVVENGEHDIWVINPDAVLDAINTVAGN
jgi:hypothetical protein